MGVRSVACRGVRAGSAAVSVRTLFVSLTFHVMAMTYVMHVVLYWSTQGSDASNGHHPPPPMISVTRNDEADDWRATTRRSCQLVVNLSTLSCLVLIFHRLCNYVTQIIGQNDNTENRKGRCRDRDSSRNYCTFYLHGLIKHAKWHSWIADNSCLECSEQIDHQTNCQRLTST